MMPSFAICGHHKCQMMASFQFVSLYASIYGLLERPKFYPLGLMRLIQSGESWHYTLSHHLYATKCNRVPEHTIRGKIKLKCTAVTERLHCFNSAFIDSP